MMIHLYSEILLKIFDPNSCIEVQLLCIAKSAPVWWCFISFNCGKLDILIKM